MTLARAPSPTVPFVAIFKQRKGAGPAFRHNGTLAAPSGFETLISVSTGLDGPVALWASASDQDVLLGRYGTAGGPSFANTRTTTNPRVALTTYLAPSLDPQTVTVVQGLPVAHPLIQDLPDGAFLVVGARCAWTVDGPENNALVIGYDGQTLRRGTLGDGIEHMLVDQAGTIWIGYFDEGILGNFGWGGRGREPLGAAGIVRWSTTFDKLWKCEPGDGIWIADCYALNVADESVWACTYTNFPVLKIRDGQLSTFDTAGIRGPSGLLVAGESVGILGDYNNRRSLRIGSVRAGLNRFTETTLGGLGSRVRPDALVCRGSVADAFVGADWFTFDLAQWV